jgi:type I restriction enzyme S subunit
MTIATAQLSEVCSFRHGGTPSKSNPTFWGGDIPWVSPKDMKTTLLLGAQDSITLKGVEESATSLVPAGSILTVVRSGILAHSVPFAIAGRSLTFNQDIKAIQVTSDKVTSEYIYWFLRSKEAEILARGVKKGATVHSLQSGFLEKLTVPILQKAEQQRIVDLLSRSENIVRMRREAEQKAKEIIPALFLDMFGDPASNPKGWVVKTIGDIASYTRYGPRFPDRRYAETGARILRTTDMDAEGSVRWKDAPVLPVSLSEAERFALQPGTIVITRTGATIGKIALFRGAEEPCIAGAYLIELGTTDEVDPDYVIGLFLSRYGQGRLTAGSRAVAQPNLNAPTIRAIQLPIPPRSLQVSFAALAAEVRNLICQQQKAVNIVDRSFQSLMGGVFGGWRER